MMRGKYDRELGENLSDLSARLRRHPEARVEAQV